MSSGEIMRKLRETAHYTQDEAARILGISTVTIQNWEQGVRIRNNTVLDGVLTLYNADPAERIRVIVSMYGSNKDFDYLNISLEGSNDGKKTYYF